MQKNDFRTAKDSADSYYDIIEDYELIEASFAQQYGIRLRYEDQMSWGEFLNLLVALNDKTPLGRIVAIRSEKRPEVLKDFTAEEKRVRNEWAKRKAQKASFDEQEYNKAMNEFKNLFKAMAAT